MRIVRAGPVAKWCTIPTLGKTQTFKAVTHPGSFGRGPGSGESCNLLQEKVGYGAVWHEQGIHDGYGTATPSRNPGAPLCHSNRQRPAAHLCTELCRR